MIPGIATLQKRNERGERRLLLNSKLEMAQLICDWAIAPSERCVCIAHTIECAG